MKRNLLSIIISLVLLLIAGECCAFAEERIELETSTWVNPMYAEYVKDVELTFRRPLTLTPSGAAETEEELAAMIRQKLVNRTGVREDDKYPLTASFSVNYVSANDIQADAGFQDRLLRLIYAHTGVPNEGDYLYWHVPLVNFGGSRSAEPVNGVYEYRLNIAAMVYSTPGQERAVTQTVDTVLEQLNIEGKSDYEKAAAIYGYICDKVTYDYDNYNEFAARYPMDETYDVYYKMFTAYGAAVDRTAVCQGIAQLLYRMLLEEGIDCRLIAGMANYRDLRENHAWNIVKIGNEYFDADATWDLGNSEDSYKYFLLTDSDFEYGGVHKRGADETLGIDFSAKSFYTEYPMSSGEPLKAYHSGACRIEDILLLRDGTVGIAICVGAEAYEKDMLAFAEIDGNIFPLNKAASFSGEEGEVIRFLTVQKAPKEMQDAICVKLYDGDGEMIPLYEHDAQNDGKWNSVAAGEYVTRVYAGIAAEADHGDTDYACVMNNLGSCAQRVLDYNADEASRLTGSGAAIAAEDLADCVQSTSGILPEGLEYAGETLELDELTTANFLFLGNAEDVDFTLDGNPAEPELNGEYYVLSVPGLKAGDLGEPHVITASDGETKYTISASALSYAYKALTEDTSPELQELAKVLYVWCGMCRE